MIFSVVQAEFKKVCRECDDTTIIIVIRKVPKNVYQEDQKLFVWYDNMSVRSGEERPRWTKIKTNGCQMHLWHVKLHCILHHRISSLTRCVPSRRCGIYVFVLQ